MWFDAQAELAKLAGGQEYDARTPATTATPATKRAHVAIVADVATPSATEVTPAQRIAPRFTIVATPDAFPHGKAINGNPRTWTGRIVALDEWRRLTEWERHGPKGRDWCGISQRWE